MEQAIFDATMIYKPEQQIQMMVEECAEFIMAVQHEKRKRIDPYDLVLEIADVSIMVDQMKLYFGDVFDAARSEKIKKLEEHLREKQNANV